MQGSQMLPGGLLASVSDHFLTYEFPWSVSPYCVLRAWEEGTLSQGAAEGRESQARWHAPALAAKWPGGVPA